MVQVVEMCELMVKHVLNKMFGKGKRSDEECWALEHFLINLMSGCGWDCRSARDFLMFRKDFLPMPPALSQVLQRWFEGNQQDPASWPVVEKRDGEPMWAWFKDNVRVSEWACVE